MPVNDQSKGRLERPAAAEGPGQPRVSRRSLLGAAGVGAAGLAAGAFGGLAAAVPAAAATKPAARHTPAERGDGGAGQGREEPVVVHVRDGGSGDLDVYRGTTHTRVHDPDLAARLRRTTR